MFRKTLLPILGIWLFTAFGVLSFAQSITSGAVTGIVTDPTGAVVPNAAVTLTNVNTNAEQKSTTNGDGSYRFGFIAPGPYKVAVVSAGFKNQERTGVEVTPGQPTTVNVQLAVASATSSVDVIEVQDVLQTANADDTTNFSAQAIQDLPNPGGDLTYLAQTVSGVVMNSQAGYGNFEANGMSGTSNLFTINGANVTDPFESINNSGASNLMLGGNDMAEANVINNAYSAQYGQYAGTQVAYITKSGTNQFHGNAVYMWNGRTMNANQFFSNSSGSPRPFNNFNQWATDVNGPIRKNKTFFDVDYEGLRNALPTAAALTLIPSPQFQKATLLNLAALGEASEIPFYNQLFAIYNGAPAASSATPVANSCNGLGANNFLAASTPCAVSFRVTPPNMDKETDWSTRIDQVFSDKDRFYGRFWRDNGFQPSFTSPFGPTFNAQSNQPQFSAAASESHTFGPNTVNQINVTGFFYGALFVPSNPTASVAALPTFITFHDGAFADAGADGAYGGNFAFPQGRRVFQDQFIDDFSHVAGKHTIRAGVNYVRTDITDLTFNENLLGQISTDLPDFFNGGGPGTKLTQAFSGAPEEGYKSSILGAYIDDDWKISERLTVTLGLRAEHYADPSCMANCFAQLATTFTGAPTNDLNTPYNQLILANQKNAYHNTPMAAWEPRIGIAWRPFQNDEKTVLRTGFGMFSDPVAGGLSDYAALNAPNYVDFTVQNSATTNYTLAPGGPASLFTAAAQSNQAFQSQFKGNGSFNSISAALPAGVPFNPPSFTNFPSTFYNPVYYKWSFELQHTVGTKTVVSANYSGMHGIRIPVQDNGLNGYCVPANCPGGFSGLPSLAPSPAFGTIIQFLPSGVANYNGLQLSLQQRVAAGFSFNVNYTWSHALDDQSNGGQNEPFSYGNGLTTDESIVGVNDPFNVSKQYGSADYDVRNYFSANLVLNDTIRHLGFKGGPNQIFGGWTVTSNLFWRSGLPFTVIDGAAGGEISNYSGVIFASPAGNLSADCNHAVDTPCLATSQFAPSAADTGVVSGFGTIGRNTLRGPHFFDLDLSIMKNVALGEHATFQFGVQAYNALNHPNFDQPVNDISNPEFGSSILQVAPPTSLLGSFVGAGSSPRFIELKGLVRF